METVDERLLVATVDDLVDEETRGVDNDVLEVGVAEVREETCELRVPREDDAGVFGAGVDEGEIFEVRGGGERVDREEEVDR